jgi:hypothetical protein
MNTLAGTCSQVKQSNQLIPYFYFRTQALSFHKGSASFIFCLDIGRIPRDQLDSYVK